MRRALLALAFALIAGPALAADCYPNAAGTQANCGAVLMWNNASAQSQPATAAAPLPVTGTVTVDTSALATSAKQDTQTTALQPATNLATAQVSVTTGNISVAATRALRRAVTITNVTGTSAIYCGNTGVATTTGMYLGATAGSSITLNTTAAVFCTVAATTQTVTVAETY